MRQTDEQDDIEDDLDESPKDKRQPKQKEIYVRCISVEEMFNIINSKLDQIIAK